MASATLGMLYFRLYAVASRLCLFSFALPDAYHAAPTCVAVTSLYHKAITRLNVLKKLGLSVPRYALLILNRSYILPLFAYGDVIYDNFSTADSCRLEDVQTSASKLILVCMQTTSHSKILKELSMSPLDLRRNCHILFALHKFLLGPCSTFLANLIPKFFRGLNPK